jgi:hypothetical protein
MRANQGSLVSRAGDASDKLDQTWYDAFCSCKKGVPISGNLHISSFLSVGDSQEYDL